MTEHSQSTEWAWRHPWTRSATTLAVWTLTALSAFAAVTATVSEAPLQTRHELYEAP